MTSSAHPAGLPAQALSNRNLFWASLFVRELLQAGVRTACIAPGSRSGPLALALAAQPGMECHALLDERGAGFFALGHGKVTGRPAVVLCTSGTAAANLHPAVLEAHHAEVPLLVLTADRPPELRDVGAGQTVDQLHLYGPTVRWFFEVGLPDLTQSALRHLRSLAGRAVFLATRCPAGPVHLNFPFHKPLEPTLVPGDVPAALVKQMAAEASPAAPYALGSSAPPHAAEATLERLAEQVRQAPRGLIVCGPMNPALPNPALPVNGAAANSAPANGGPVAMPYGGRPAPEWPAALALLARRTGYPILAEPPAGVHCGDHDSSRMLLHPEAILRAPAFRARLRPQLVLRFGAMSTHKHVEVLLEEHPDCPVVLVQPSGAWLEPTHHRAQVVCAEPAAFCGALAERLQGHQPAPGWISDFWRADRLAGQAVAALYEAPPPQGLQEEWFEGRVFPELAELLPAGATVVTASSMPVRDLATFFPLIAKPARHVVNRGVNGIDGTLSTALGVAAARRQAGESGPTVLVTGDLAFFHDSTALLAAKTQGLALTVLLLNNDGGGIFEFLPIAQHGELYERFFGTPHGIDFERLCAAYGVPLLRPASWADWREVVGGSLREQGVGQPSVRVVEIRTNRKRNREQHRLVWQAVAERLEREFAAVPPVP